MTINCRHSGEGRNPEFKKVKLLDSGLNIAGMTNFLMEGYFENSIRGTS
ncbi:MAG: hypothetical protein AAB317_00465 [Nitrospirota bacterium]